MALEGSLRDFGLADILQLIFFQRKTGALVLESRIDRVRLLFVEGNIVGAESRKTNVIARGFPGHGGAVVDRPLDSQEPVGPEGQSATVQDVVFGGCRVVDGHRASG